MSARLARRRGWLFEPPCLRFLLCDVIANGNQSRPGCSNILDAQQMFDVLMIGIQRCEVASA